MNWIIVTEPYSDASNGIRSMHNICHLLNEQGENAYLAFITQNPNFLERRIFTTSNNSFLDSNLLTKPITQDLLTEEFLKDCIVVYPDILVGNPLKAKKIVRYLGNKQANWPHKNFLNIEKGAFILSHSNIFHEKPNAVLFNPKIDPIFFEENKTINFIEFKKRNLDLLYYGKGIYYGECKNFKNTFLLDRSAIKDKHQVCLLLKQCRFLFTYDALSNLNAEAVAAGAVPIILRYDPWTEQEINNLEHSYLPRGNFLNIDNDIIYGNVDYEKFSLQKETFIKSIKLLENSWISRFSIVKEEIKKYFKNNMYL